MFEHLPEITQGSYQTFIDRELLEVLNNLNEYMGQLRGYNKYLAQAIGAGATTVAEDFTGDTKEIVKGDAVAAQLAVLRLIDRATEAKQLELTLSQKASSKK